MELTLSESRSEDLEQSCYSLNEKLKSTESDLYGSRRSPCALTGQLDEAASCQRRALSIHRLQKTELLAAKDLLTQQVVQAPKGFAHIRAQVEAPLRRKSALKAELQSTKAFLEKKSHQQQAGRSGNKCKRRHDCSRRKGKNESVEKANLSFMLLISPGQGSDLT